MKFSDVRYNKQQFRNSYIKSREAIEVLDLRSLYNYKIQQGALQQNLSKFYKFESAENVCNQFNNLINTLKKEEKLERGEKYPLKTMLNYQLNCSFERYHNK